MKLEMSPFLFASGPQLANEDMYESETTYILALICSMLYKNPFLNGETIALVPFNSIPLCKGTHQRVTLRDNNILPMFTCCYTW